LKSLLKQYRPVIKFIAIFLLVYGVLSLVYSYYLDASKGTIYYPDYVTNLVANQSKLLLDSFGYNSQVLPHPEEPSMKLLVNGKYVARIIEGCNGASVIILFIAFVIAFSGQAKTTFFYILSGSVLIYIVNLFRIVILAIGLYHFPWRKDILHSIIFPGMIYGMVFLLWMFWVNGFTKMNKKA